MDAIIDIIEIRILIEIWIRDEAMYFASHLGLFEF